MVVAVVLAVALLAAGVVAAVLLTGDDNDEPDLAAEATQWVEGYFAALGDGDADQALTYLDTSRVEDRSLLTDAVLAESAELGGGVSEVEVAIDDRLSTARVDLLLGDQPHTLEMTIDRVGDDWVIRTGVVTYHDANLTGLPLTVNGVAPADAGSFTVFPGVYELDAGEYLTWGESPRVLGLEDESLGLALTATADGERAAHEAVQETVGECTRSRDLQPVGCPFQGPIGIPGLQPASVRWDLVGPARWDPVLERGVLTGDLQLTVRLRATSTDGMGRVVAYDKSSALTLDTTVDLTATELEPTFS